MTLNLMIAPVVMVIIAGIKEAQLIDKRWLPLLALAVGLLCGGIFAAIEPQNAVQHCINGLLYGGAAAGIYDAGASALKPRV